MEQSEQMVGNRSSGLGDKVGEKMRSLLVSNTRVTQIVLAVALVGSIAGIYQYGLDWSTLALIIFGYFLYVCLGIVVMFHRNLTHQSYKTYPIIEKIFSFLGCMANTGSSLVWTAIHIKHHLKSDKEGDPHSPWIKGWKVFLLDYPVDDKIKWRMRHLVTDPYHRFLHQNYYLLLLGWSLLLFALGGWYLMIFLHWAPMVVSAIMSNIVNYSGHKESWLGSYRRFKLSDHSCNNWIWALPSWGEGWHNNHHRYPKNYTTSQRWWELDPSGWIIRLIKIS
jgi:stearoyl-CoA desaturase (Delta-9 desaturase)